MKDEKKTKAQLIKFVNKKYCEVFDKERHELVGTEHGGSMEVDNRPGDGVTFSIRLPMRAKGAENHGEKCDRN